MDAVCHPPQGRLLPISYFEKVHAGKDLQKLYAESAAAGDLIQATVRMVVDYSDKPDEDAAAKK